MNHFLLVALLIILAAPVYGAEIVPISYSGTPGQMGWYPWYDETGEQLTDGVYGGPSPNEPGFPGRTNYDWYPWVGWDSTPCTNTFDFSAGAVLTSLEIHTQKDTEPSIYIPAHLQAVGYDGFGQIAFERHWYYSDSEFADGYRYILAEALPGVEVQSLVLYMEPTTRWILVSEIDFYGTAVPEPSAILVLLPSMVVFARRAERCRHNRH